MKSPTLQQIMLTRRNFLQNAGMGALAGAAIAAIPLRGYSSENSAQLGFNEVPKTLSKTLHIPNNYSSKPLLKWGDNLHNNTPFNPHEITEQSQQQSFGFNNDFIAYMPLKGSSNHGLLCVNHEYVNAELMFSKHTKYQNKTAIEMAAHGCSIVEIKRINGDWQVIRGSHYNRRITATTPMQIAGAASGSPAMQTSHSPDGRNAIGTLGNCSGGITPWQTVLTAEENFDVYFVGDKQTISKPHYKHYQIGQKPHYNWHKTHNRFNLSHEPNEPNHFGWIVEYDPYNPHSTPIKRTSLGRFKHECARTHLNYDNRVVIYSGDDEMFQYLYRYVSCGKYIAGDNANNSRLLDDGCLYVAKFEANGKMKWLPLVHGEPDLKQFSSQADILINTRAASDALGATPMDRPEDIEISPDGTAIYVSLTMNALRETSNPTNTRVSNNTGHILQLNPPRINDAIDHTAETFSWQPFLLAGDPQNPSHRAKYQNPPSKHGWLTNPDNLAVDNAGNLWIATDGQEKLLGINDALYATPTTGANSGSPKCFLTAPTGAEVTGPAFTPDCKTLFVSIQHPAEGSSYDQPSTRWPDFNPSMPPRPSVVAITHTQGKIIGEA